MKRFLIWVLFWGVYGSAVFAQSSGVVVLTETPVEEFTLPDGSVVKNAFVWRRSSEGLMIVHDDGQFFLNYKTLPDEWKAAYLGEPEEKGPKEPVEPEFEMADRFEAGEILKEVPGLSERARQFILQKDAPEGCEETALALALFESLMEKDYDAARRFYLLIEEMQLNIDGLDLTRLIYECKKCSGKGKLEMECPHCAVKKTPPKRVSSKDNKKSQTSKQEKELKKSKQKPGYCPDCEGEGSVLSSMKTKRECPACGGTGECPKCKGKVNITVTCRACRGRGKMVDVRYAEVLRFQMTRRANMLANEGQELPLTKEELADIKELFKALPKLDAEARAYYLSDEYDGEQNTKILVACLMQALLTDELKSAELLNLMIDVQVKSKSKKSSFDIDTYLKPCETCEMKGLVETECSICEGEGLCPDCEGTGEKKTELSIKGVFCGTCKGEGICPGCDGEGVRMVRCKACKGSGRVFEEERTAVKLEVLARELNDDYKAYLKEKEKADAEAEIRYAEILQYKLTRPANVLAARDQELRLTAEELAEIKKQFRSLPTLNADARAYYLSDKYDGAQNQIILTACLMQALLTDDLRAAELINVIINVQPDDQKNNMDINAYLQPCEPCEAKGRINGKCNNCGGDGFCADCGGAGKQNANRSGSQTQCSSCKGEGTCAACGGDGVRMLRCKFCKGVGRKFEKERLAVKMEELIQELNAQYSANLKTAE